MKLRSGYENRRPRIEMVPLMDSMFLLLTVFIYAVLSMVVHRGLKIELPGAITGTVDKRDYISVTLTEHDELYLDDEPTSLEVLVQKITERLAARPVEQPPVFISGDAGADLGMAVKVFDRLRAAGVKQIFVETKEEER